MKSLNCFAAVRRVQFIFMLRDPLLRVSEHLMSDGCCFVLSESSLSSFQMLPEDQQKNDGGDGGSCEICDRLGIKYGRGFFADQWQEKDQKHIKTLSEQRERQRCFGPFHGGKAVHQYILETQRNDGEGENADAPDGKPGNLRIRGKEADEMYRQKAGHDKHKGGKAKAQKQTVFFRIPDPPGICGTVVKTDQSLRAAADPQHGRSDEQHIALNDGSGGDQKIALVSAVFLQNGVGSNEKYVI